MRNVCYFIFILLILNSCKSTTYQNSTAPDTILYLVRHAEKQLPVAGEKLSDPDLTEAGKQRALALAHQLGDEPITHIFSSDFRRTKQTVAPLAKQKGLDIQLYNPRKLDDFAAQLRDTKGRILVSGHSNSTPNLVKLLGGAPGPPIAETWEYDRLYVLVINGKQTTTLSMRYGERAKP